MWLTPVMALALASAAAPQNLPRSPLLAPGSSWEKVIGGLGFGEGPAWHPDGYLLFEDVTSNRTLKLDASGQVSVFREATDGANGLAFDKERRLDREAVYRVDRDGTLTRVVDSLTRPNGIVVSSDGRTLYVAENASPGGAEGRIWATAGTKEKAGIYVFMPDAKRRTATLVTVIPMPEDPTNCTFGGPRRDVLYVTTTASLYRIRTAVRGVASPPGK